MNQTPKECIALDVGGYNIRLCHMIVGKDGIPLVKKYFCDRFEPGAEVLKKYVDYIMSCQCPVYCTVPGHSVFTRCKTLPPVPEEKVEQIIRYEVQEQIPFDLDQISLDHMILEKLDGGGYGVLFAAIKRDVIAKHLNLLEAIASRVTVVNTSPLALFNWFSHLGEFSNNDERVAVINLGDETIDIVIGQNETFKFTRPLNVGGRSITAGIAEDLGIEFDKAEEVKHDPDKTWLSDPIVTTGTDGDVESQTISAMKDIVEQIKRTFAYFSSVPGGGQVDRIVLTGGGSTNAEISNYLYENLGLSVDIVDIFGDLNIESSEVNDFSNSSAVLGLALQGVNGVPLKINLLPESITTPQKSTNQVLKELVGTLIDLIVPDGDDS